MHRTAGPMFSFSRGSPEQPAQPPAQPERAAQPEWLRAASRRPLTERGGRRGAAEVIAGSCDRCPATAAVRAGLPSGSVLMLCGHHGRRYAPALLVQGAVVTGELAFPARTSPPAPARAPAQ